MKIRRKFGGLGRWILPLFGCFIGIPSGIAAFQADAQTILPGALSSPPSLPAMEIASAAAGEPSTAEPGSDAVRASIRARYGRIPMHFEPNLGQTADEVRYLARAPGYTLFLTEKEAVLVLRKGLQDKAQRDGERGAGASLPTRSPARGKRSEPETPPPAVVRMRLEGTDLDATPKVEGLERLPGVSNYLLGKDPAKWRSNVPHYARVRYPGVYPGIDLVFYGNPRQLEYDFVVAAGADPAHIRLSFEGADGMRIDADGNLVLAVAGGEFVQRAPRIYQEVNGTRRPIAGGYRLLSVSDKAEKMTDATDFNHAVGFRLAAYDGSRSLVIDPLVEYSTYLGGSGSDGAYGIAVDDAGNAYVAGWTTSLDFPLANARYPDRAGGSDAFVVKLDPEGKGPVYATYLGGSARDEARGIAVDTSGNAYVVGGTESSDFPAVNAPYPDYAGGVADGFVVKLDAEGQGPLYATYLGGSGEDFAETVAVDVSGNAYVAGDTSSLNFPAVNARYPDYGGGYADAFVVKLDAEGQGPVYATYLGGSVSDFPESIAADAAGNAYVAGRTWSPDFPVVNACYPNLLGDSDAFVVKLDPGGQGPVYATYLGGSNSDFAGSIAVDASGNAYVAGSTDSSDFPTVNALYSYHAGYVYGNAFVVKLNPEGQGPVYATYLGGSGFDDAYGISIDAVGNAYVAGWTWSPDFPTVNARYPNPAGEGDAFVVKLDSEGQGPIYATYLGGSARDRAVGIAADAEGNAYVAGHTKSPDFPTVNALYPNYAGGGDAFVTRLTDGVNIRGNVILADGTPICAMVLANGGYMFSCDGAGSYELSVPLDENGAITLFSFADGFAPFRLTAAPENLPSVLHMQTAAPDSPSIHMSREVECSTTNRVRIDGTVRSESGQPLCALVLANGQHMFSCDASQGVYDLDVPIDENGQVTIFGFADSFQPYSETFVAPNCTGVPSA